MPTSNPPKLQDLPTKRDYDMTRFYQWLVGTARNAPGTAGTYSRVVRRVLREIETAQLEDVMLYCQAHPVHSGFRTAWNAFAEYAATRGFHVDTIPSSANSKRRSGIHSAPRPALHVHEMEITRIVSLAFDRHYPMTDPILFSNFRREGLTVYMPDARDPAGVRLFESHALTTLQQTALNTLLVWGWNVSDEVLQPQQGQTAEAALYHSRLNWPILIQTPRATTSIPVHHLAEIADACGDARVVRRLGPAVKAARLRGEYAGSLLDAILTPTEQPDQLGIE